MNNRTIKFRCWDNVKKAWTSNFWMEGSGTTLAFIEDGRISICQFTGLHDKNGKEIYEGDIVKWNDTLYGNEKPHGPKTVEWDNGFSGFTPFVDYDCDCGVYVDNKSVEVIGNIYENPNLLTQPA